MRDTQKKGEPETGPPEKAGETSASERAAVLSELKGLVRRVHEKADDEALPPQGDPQ